ncbi:helix-turn-helix transcriptional regulator [Actinomadura kijaniata]|uniref:Transcriptional regulator with XRE-family HTH domain n=2 Tax=Actinomadura TaxID=1988 RepID=A0A7W3LMT8_ACTNM|nr:helix-turn-helix transcriptional regulator [Actinomadura namibiensis]MBA8951019.1 transcriptional regulator with XRE-family HTH domain [Actinomadura namibiensis]
MTSTATPARTLSTPTGPLVPRLLLGTRLRELRRQAGLSRPAAARAVGMTEATLGRLERGRTGCDPAGLAALAALYGVRDEAERVTLEALAEQTNIPGWWEEHLDVLPKWARRYVSAEQTAKLVRTFEPQLVPDLLQTPDYAREILRLRHPRATPAELERRVAVVMARQRVLRRRPRPVNLWIVLDESVLLRQVGGRLVIRDQLEHLLDLDARPNVTLQIATFEAGAATAMTGGSLTLVRFPQQILPDLVYLERFDGASYPSRPDEVERHWHVFNTLVTEAQQPEATPHIIRRLLRGL